MSWIGKQYLQLSINVLSIGLFDVKDLVKILKVGLLNKPDYSYQNLLKRFVAKLTKNECVQKEKRGISYLPNSSMLHFNALT